MSVLEDLRSKREALTTEIRTLTAAELPEEREAAEEANGLIAGRLKDRDALDTRIAQLEVEDSRRAADEKGAVRAGATVEVVKEPLTYEKGNGRSYFRDLINQSISGDLDSQERLQRHGREMQVEEQRINPMFRATSEKRGFNGGGGAPETRVNPNRTDGQGGYMVPPLWLMDELVPALRPGRATANLVQNKDLPPGTDSINLPKVLTGTVTAPQADGAPVSSVDITDTFVTGGVKTIAGQQDIAMQLLDQSPINFDEVTLTDLLADYNQKVDIQVLYGANSQTQVKGVTNVTGINAVTFTSGSPTVPLLYVPLQQAQSLIAKARFLPPTAFVMHPSRWYWIAAALDSSNRPLIPPTVGAFNPMGTLDPNTVQGGGGLNVGGLSVVLDANISQTLNTNQDQILCAKWDDIYLYEGAPRMRVLQEVLSGTLQIRIQLWNYIAVIADRFPVAVSTIGGVGNSSTGLVTVAGY